MKSKMVEIKEKDIDIIKYSPKTKSKQGVLLGLIQRFRNDAEKGIIYSPLELSKIFEEAYRNYAEKNILIDYHIIQIEQWQGKNSYELYKGFDNDFYILEYRKDKETGEIEKSKPIKINKAHLNYMLYLISKLTIGEHRPARYFWTKLIKHYNLKKKGVDVLNFNGGGSNRAEHYFPLYLFPARVLEQIGLIKISNGKGGGIIKIR